MPWGAGSVAGPDKDGRWELRVSLRTDADGKRVRVKQRVHAANKTDALRALERLRERYGAVRRGKSKQPALTEYLHSWIRRKEEKLTEKTICNYRLSAAHIVPVIGHVRIDLIEHTHVSLLIDRMRDLGRGQRTVQAAYDTLRACLYFAVKTDRILASSPIVSVPRPTHHYELGYYSREEAKRFLEAVADDRLRALFYLVVAVGLRRGEVLGLKWQDLNVADALLSVRRALGQSGAMKATKTKKAQRMIALPQSTLEELLAHRARQEKEGLAQCEIMFSGRDGRPIDPRMLYEHHFLPAMKRAGLRRIRFHDLRHTAATIRLAAGDHPNVVQEMLGHTKVETTLGVYGHVVPTMQRDSATLYDRLMSEEKGRTGA